MSGTDVKTSAIVLRRTNYGEADRILNVLTPEGKMTVLARGVRKEKSRLAGGIEMFCLSDIVVHKGKSEFAVLTSAKMNKFFKGLLSDYTRVEVATDFLKKTSRAAEAVDSPEYFTILLQSLEALSSGYEVDIIKAWFYLNLLKASGEQVNLLTDTNGEKLVAGKKYSWDSLERAFSPSDVGKISTNEIKLLRLMLSADLALVLRVKLEAIEISEVLYIAQALFQI